MNVLRIQVFGLENFKRLGDLEFGLCLYINIYKHTVLAEQKISYSNKISGILQLVISDDYFTNLKSFYF